MISEAQQVEQIRIIAAADPDYSYDSEPGGCTYLPNDRNRYGCIVGESLLDLGVSRELLGELDEISLGGESAVWGAPNVVRVLGASVSVQALDSRWIRYVQLTQDTGESWGAAVAAADEVGRQEGWAPAVSREI